MIDIKETNEQWLNDFKKIISNLCKQAQIEVKRNGENALDSINRNKVKIIDSVSIKWFTDIEIIFSSKVVNDPGQDRLKVLAYGGIIMIKNNSKNTPVSISESPALKKLLDIANALKVI